MKNVKNWVPACAGMTGRLARRLVRSEWGEAILGALVLAVMFVLAHYLLWAGFYMGWK